MGTVTPSLTIAVTGATGFVGNFVVQQLLKQGHKVVVATRNPKGLTNSWAKHVTLKQWDLSVPNPVGLYSYFEQPDKFIYLAWQGLEQYNNDSHYKTAAQSYSFLKQLVEEGLTDITVAGTCFEYGLQEGALKPDTACKPVTAYGKAKLQLCQHLLALKTSYPFKLKWGRLFYLYGEGQSNTCFLPALQQAIARGDEIFKTVDITVLRDYLEISEAGLLLDQLALLNTDKGIVNICSGSPVSLVQLALNYVEQHKATIKIMAGAYPKPPYEPLAFWGA